jgi:hypothetical protein
MLFFDMADESVPVAMKKQDEIKNMTIFEAGVWRK